MFPSAQKLLGTSPLHLQYQLVCQREREATARNKALLRDLAMLKARLEMTSLCSREARFQRLAVLKEQYQMYVESEWLAETTLTQAPVSASLAPREFPRTASMPGRTSLPNHTVQVHLPTRQPDPLTVASSTPPERQMLLTTSELSSSYMVSPGPRTLSTPKASLEIQPLSSSPKVSPHSQTLPTQKPLSPSPADDPSTQPTTRHMTHLYPEPTVSPADHSHSSILRPPASSDPLESANLHPAAPRTHPPAPRTHPPSSAAAMTQGVESATKTTAALAMTHPTHGVGVKPGPNLPLETVQDLESESDSVSPEMIQDTEPGPRSPPGMGQDPEPDPSSPEVIHGVEPDHSSPPPRMNQDPEPHPNLPPGMGQGPKPDLSSLPEVIQDLESDHSSPPGMSQGLEQHPNLLPEMGEDSEPDLNSPPGLGQDSEPDFNSPPEVEPGHSSPPETHLAPEPHPNSRPEMGQHSKPNSPPGMGQDSEPDLTSPPGMGQDSELDPNSPPGMGQHSELDPNSPPGIGQDSEPDPNSPPRMGQDPKPDPTSSPPEHPSSPPGMCQDPEPDPEVVFLSDPSATQTTTSAGQCSGPPEPAMIPSVTPTPAAAQPLPLLVANAKNTETGGTPAAPSPVAAVNCGGSKRGEHPAAGGGFSLPPAVDSPGFQESDLVLSELSTCSLSLSLPGDELDKDTRLMNGIPQDVRTGKDTKDAELSTPLQGNGGGPASKVIGQPMVTGQPKVIGQPEVTGELWEPESSLSSVSLSSEPRQVPKDDQLAGTESTPQGGGGVLGDVEQPDNTALSPQGGEPVPKDVEQPSTDRSESVPVLAPDVWDGSSTSASSVGSQVKPSPDAIKAPPNATPLTAVDTSPFVEADTLPEAAAYRNMVSSMPPEEEDTSVGSVDIEDELMQALEVDAAEGDQPSPPSASPQVESGDEKEGERGSEGAESVPSSRKLSWVASQEAMNASLKRRLGLISSDESDSDQDMDMRTKPEPSPLNPEEEEDEFDFTT